jgi:hypothetical protein
MSLPPIDDVAALHDRMDAAERQHEVWATHHHMLATQIAELTVGIRTMSEKNAEMQQSLLDMERRIPELMAAGIVAAVGNPATWQAGREAMKRQARDAAGGWLLGGLRFVADKLMWAGVALLAIYMLGGWPAIAAALKVKGTTP